MVDPLRYLVLIATPLNALSKNATSELAGLVSTVHTKSLSCYRLMMLIMIIRPMAFG